MQDIFHLIFSSFEATAQALETSARDWDIVREVHRRAESQLWSDGLAGSWTGALEARLRGIQREADRLSGEVAEMARDLSVVAQMARDLSATVALQFSSQQSAWVSDALLVPQTGGGTLAPAERMALLDSNIARLQKGAAQLRADIASLTAVGLKDRAWGVLAGVNYDEMLDRAQESLKRHEAVIAQVTAQRALQAAPKPETGFGDLSVPHAVVEPPPAEPPPSSAPASRPRQYGYERWSGRNDKNGCALFAQSAVLEAMGYDFNESLNNARAQGIAEGWYRPNGKSAGATGLGQPFDQVGIPYERQWGASTPGGISREEALNRLTSELNQGNYAVVNIYAPELSAYKNQTGVAGHTVWVQRTIADANGAVTAVEAYDSHFGEVRQYPLNEFLNAWDNNKQGTDFNSYAIYVHSPSKR